MRVLNVAYWLKTVELCTPPIRRLSGSMRSSNVSLLTGKADLIRPALEPKADDSRESDFGPGFNSKPTFPCADSALQSQRVNSPCMTQNCTLTAFGGFRLPGSPEKYLAPLRPLPSGAVALSTTQLPDTGLRGVRTGWPDQACKAPRADCIGERLAMFGKWAIQTGHINMLPTVMLPRNSQKKCYQDFHRD